MSNNPKFNFFLQLYDLMVMAVKQQILLSSDPKDLVMVTLNHLDAIHDYVRNPAAKANLEMTHDMLVQGGAQFNKKCFIYQFSRKSYFNSVDKNGFESLIL